MGSGVSSPSTRCSVDKPNPTRGTTSNCALTPPLMPRRECDGYPPPMFPPLNAEEEVDFFLAGKEATTECSLACSLVRCVDHASNSQQLVRVYCGAADVPFDIDSSKPLIIICHGYLSWRNQLLLGRLAIGLSKEMKCHTLRFDFTGSGHSAGTWRYGNFKGEVRDLKRIVHFVETKMKTRVISVVGHLKASVAVLQHAWEQEEESNNNPDVIIPYFVSLSGRCYPQEHSEIIQSLTKPQQEFLKTQKKYTLYLLGTRQFVVTEKDIEERDMIDSSPVQNIRRASVLVVHGGNDKVVDVSNAERLATMIPNHQLCIIDGADHNYNRLESCSNYCCIYIRQRKRIDKLTF